MTSRYVTPRVAFNAGRSTLPKLPEWVTSVSRPRQGSHQRPNGDEQPIRPVWTEATEHMGTRAAGVQSSALALFTSSVLQHAVVVSRALLRLTIGEIRVLGIDPRALPDSRGQPADQDAPHR